MGNKKHELKCNIYIIKINWHKKTAKQLSLRFFMFW